MTTMFVYDATHADIGQLPAGQLAAGYSTGSGSVPWNADDWAAHPGAVRICQDPGATDTTADVLDVEAGAATIADCAPWAKAALASYKAATRPGQRSPAIYTSRAEVTLVVNALIADGVPSGVGLWIADWNDDQAQATAEVTATGGPFPVIGRQFRNAGPYDVSVFSAEWLAAVSGQPDPQPQPTQEDAVVLDLAVNGPAVVLPVPSGAKTLTLYADDGYKGEGAPQVRVVFAGPGHGIQEETPRWGEPAVLAVPAGSGSVSLARLGTVATPVTAAWS